MTLESSSAENAPSFGYLPDPDRIEGAVVRGAFTRGLVLDLPVRSLADGVPNCRTLWNAEVPLPEGVYWFEGIEQPIILQVAVGAPAGPATIAPLSEITEEHPLMAAYAWAEQFWEQADPVPTPQFEVNDVAVLQPGDVDVTVRGRKFLTQQWSYTVVGDGRQQEVLESQLRPRPQVDSPRAWVTQAPTPASRFGATLTRAKLLGKFSDTLFSFRATRTTFRPYQFKPVLKLLQTGKAHLLIADEVGLGKTIEAGLIWTELEARQEADRVLVVCPMGATSGLRKRGWSADSGSGDTWSREDRQVKVLTPDAARGLEFDAVIVVEPAEFPKNFGRFGPLYTALTRANRELAVVHSEKLPRELLKR